MWWLRRFTAHKRRARPEAGASGRVQSNMDSTGGGGEGEGRGAADQGGRPEPRDQEGETADQRTK